MFPTAGGAIIDEAVVRRVRHVGTNSFGQPARIRPSLLRRDGSIHKARWRTANVARDDNNALGTLGS